MFLALATTHKHRARGRRQRTDKQQQQQQQLVHIKEWKTFLRILDPGSGIVEKSFLWKIKDQTVEVKEFQSGASNKLISIVIYLLNLLLFCEIVVNTTYF